MVAAYSNLPKRYFFGAGDSLIAAVGVRETSQRFRGGTISRGPAPCNAFLSHRPGTNQRHRATRDHVNDGKTTSADGAAPAKETTRWGAVSETTSMLHT
jgi:hypothetical protein